MQQAQQFFQQLNTDYLQLHQREGKLFWLMYTGQSHDEAGFAAASQAREQFVSDPQRLAQVRQHITRIEMLAACEARETLLHGLRGWLRLFESNAVESDEARRLMAELTAMDAALFSQRAAYTMTHRNVRGEIEEASPAVLRTNRTSNPDEACRLSSHEALQGLERWVLTHGFLEIISKRNAFARAQGYRDYFAYRVQQTEHMSAEDLFRILDDFELRTRESHQLRLKQLKVEHGASALFPHNLSYFMRAKAVEESDAYLPYAQGLRRWAESFRRMGISYRGATLQLDLLDRKGKFQTGFCIAATPPYVDAQNQWIAADIGFTSTAKPSQAGSGAKGLEVLFHEAGHAAHFANIAQNAPCFAQQDAPSSRAFLETQAKFFDAIPHDADWLKRYATDARGNSMPDHLLKAEVEARQSNRAFAERQDLVPSYFEAALYQMDDAERTPESVLALARGITQRILGIENFTGYVLAIPHAVMHNVAATYHAYLLAKMAASQIRAHLFATGAYIVDNPAIGPLMARHFWQAGNSITLDRALQTFTGEGFTGRHLADECNQSAASAWAAAQARMQAAELRGTAAVYPASLNAGIKVVDGAEVIAGNEQSADVMATQFESWVARNHA